MLLCAPIQSSILNTYTVQKYVCFPLCTCCHRVKQICRILVAEAASKGYPLVGGVFELPHIKLAYTPQCLAMVKSAREVVSAETDDHAAEALEEAAFQRSNPDKSKTKKQGKEGYIVHCCSCPSPLLCPVLLDCLQLPKIRSFYQRQPWRP